MKNKVFFRTVGIILFLGIIASGCFIFSWVYDNNRCQKLDHQLCQETQQGNEYALNNRCWSSPNGCVTSKTDEMEGTLSFIWFSILMLIGLIAFIATIFEKPDIKALWKKGIMAGVILTIFISIPQTYYFFTEHCFVSNYYPTFYPPFQCIGAESYSFLSVFFINPQYFLPREIYFKFWIFVLIGSNLIFYIILGLLLRSAVQWWSRKRSKNIK